MTNAERLFSDLVADPIYEHIRDWVEGKDIASFAIVAALDPIADLLVELWPMITIFELDALNPDLFDLIKTLPSALVRGLNELTEGVAR